VARDLANMPIMILHVVPGAAGTGTFENPYGTIAAAMADGLAPTSIVYTPQGGAFIETVNLVAGTQLRSNGPTQIVQSLQGPLTLPGSGVTTDLTMLPSSITGNVNMANNTMLSGFAVTGTVSATGVMNATIDTNRIRQPLAMDAVVLTNSTGMTLNNLLIDQAGNRGVGVDNSSATISNVTLSTITNDAIELNNIAGNNTVTVNMVTISGTMGEGIDTNLNGAGNLNATVLNSSVASTGNAISAVESAVSTGDLHLAINGSTASSTAGTGITVDGTMGAGTTFVSSFQGNSVSAAMAGGVSFNGVTFDATPGGAIDPVQMNSLAIGAATGRVTGNGASFVATVGDVNMGDADIFNTTSTGLFVNNSPMLTLRSQAGSTLDTLTGPALDLTMVTTALVFDTVTSTNSPGRAASFNTVDGSLMVTTTNANDAANPPFIYTNIPLPFNVSFGNTTINSMQGSLITDNETRVGAVGGLPAANIIYNPLQIVFP